MTRQLLVLGVATILTLAAGTAMAAESIKDRLGVTGRIGFIVPADSEAVSLGVAVNRNTDVGIIGGGGFIYGITDHIAADLDITHATFGSSGPDFDTTNISFGVQYRFLNVPVAHLVPYVGGGLDILLNDASGGFDVDNVVGGHANAGIDYFLQRQIALTVDLKGVLAPEADVHTGSGAPAGKFDPTSFATTVGVRYFFN